MSLLESIKEGRGRRLAKELWPQTAFAAVAAIVRDYGLRSLAQLDNDTVPSSAPPARERLSLFPLLSAGQYHLAQEIIRQYNNPYLGYARTPADIILSQRLFLAHPDLDPGILATTPLAEIWRQNTACQPEP